MTSGSSADDGVAAGSWSGARGGGIPAVALCSGDATGEVLRLDVPLSFWGGTSLDGEVIDRHHPHLGGSITGRVLVMHAGRGSSSSSSVLAEQLRRGTGPTAIVLAEPDAIVALGAMVAAELYAVSTPVVAVAAEELARLRGRVRVRAMADGSGHVDLT